MLRPYLFPPLVDLFDQIASLEMVRTAYDDEREYLTEELERVEAMHPESEEPVASNAPTLNGMPSISGNDDDMSEDEADSAIESAAVAADSATGSSFVAHAAGAMDAAARLVFPFQAPLQAASASTLEQRAQEFFGDEYDPRKKLSDYMARVIDRGIVNILESSEKMHITPVAALAEYFNTSEVMLLGDATYNYLARTCRPLFSPYRAGCLHATSLEEAIQIAFIFAFLHDEARLWTKANEQMNRQDEDYEKDDDGGADEGDPNDPRIVRETIDRSLQTTYGMSTFLSTCYNVQKGVRETGRARQRKEIAQIFAAHPSMRTMLLDGYETGKLPVDLLSTRAPVQFVIASAESNPSPTELALVEVKTNISPSADVPAGMPFDQFCTNYSANIKVERAPVTDEDRAYQASFLSMYTQGRQIKAPIQFPHPTTLSPTSFSQRAPSDGATTPPNQNAVEREVTVYAQPPMAVGGVVLNALLHEDMAQLSDQMTALLGSTELLTAVKIDAEAASQKVLQVKQRVQSYIHEYRANFSKPQTYGDASTEEFANLGPFRRTAEPIRAVVTTLQSSDQPDTSDNELVLRMKAARVSNRPSNQPPSTVGAATFAFTMLAPLREAVNALSPAVASSGALWLLKNQLRGSHMLQPFLSARNARVQHYLKQARLYGESVSQVTRQLRNERQLDGEALPPLAKPGVIGSYLHM